MGGAGFAIRGMREEDYDALVDLWGSAGLPYHPQGRDGRARLTRELGTSMAVFLVAEADGRLIGSLLGTTDGRKGWMNRLAVRPGWRRRGVATALLQEMERIFEERGILVICALIQDDNPISQRLFRKAGYEEDRGVVYFSKRRSRDV
jgi:ribosomal protein S18 acetylase RimI-like enzyme